VARKTNTALSIFAAEPQTRDAFSTPTAGDQTMNALSFCLVWLANPRRAAAATSPVLCAAALFGVVCYGPAIADETSAVGDVGAPSAFKPGLVYDGAVFANLGGGVRPGGTYTSNLNLQLNIDAGGLFGWSDTIAYLDALWLQGGRPSSFIGDAQGVSSISAPNAVRLYEAWIQKNFLGNHVSVLAGLYDLNSEFYRLQSAGLFLNSSFGIGAEFAQSGVEGPSIFPDTSVGMRVAFKSQEGLVVRVAVLDGVPVNRPDGSRGIFRRGDGALIVAEVDLLDRPDLRTRPASSRLRIGRQAMLGEYDSKLAIGGWYYTATFDDLSETQSNGQPLQHRGSSGFYALIDKSLYKDPGKPERKLAGFVQAGLGDYRVDRFGGYVGTGLTAVGMIAGRPNDELGLGLAYARNGSHYMSAQRMQGLPVTNAEKTIELTYLIQVNSWLALQPDLQYVITPNTTIAIPNAWAFQLRVEMSF
jgi:porin